MKRIMILIIILVFITACANSVPTADNTDASVVDDGNDMNEPTEIPKAPEDAKPVQEQPVIEPTEGSIGDLTAEIDALNSESNDLDDLDSLSADLEEIDW